jgi:hypothetical protein
VERWHFEQLTEEFVRRSGIAVDEVARDRLAHSVRIAKRNDTARRSIGMALATLWCSLSLQHA